MAMTEWFLRGEEFVNCNCSYGCPCQFNALPTHGNCQAVMGYRFDEGRFGDVELNGLYAAAMYSWPGAVHEGNGTMQIIIDERADPRQREALEKIMMGKETKDMGTMWWVYSAMSPNKLPTLFEHIELDVDVDSRRARLVVPNLIEAEGEPIRNPVTGAEHRARIDLPHGFEYRLAEIASGRSKTTGQIRLEMNKSYGQFARLHLSHNGVVG